MILKNGTVYDDSFEPVKTDIAVEGEKIAKLAPGQAGEGFDLTGMTVIPGMIDMHIHGCGGADAGDPGGTGRARTCGTDGGGDGYTGGERASGTGARWGERAGRRGRKHAEHR